MATRVIMPTLGLTMEQGTITRWLKREGDPVERDEPLFTVETDKATMDVPSPAAGVLARVLVPDGGTVPVLETIAIIAAPGEQVAAEPRPFHPEGPDSLAQPPNAAPPGSAGGPPAPSTPPPPPSAPANPATPPPTTAPPQPTAASPTPASPATAVSPAPSAPTAPATSQHDGARPGWPASPRARRIAAELGVDLSQLAGTGPGGRIVEADVRRAAAGQDAPRARVSPLAQRLALELGVDLSQLAGTGPGGRIRREDVQTAARAHPLTPSQPSSAPVPPTAAPSQPPPMPAPPAAPAAVSLPAPAAPTPMAPAPSASPGQAAATAGRLATLSRLRRITAERMARSARSVARVTLFAEVAFGEAVRFRAQLLPEFERRYGARLTYDTLIARACAQALAEHPALNAHWTDEGPRLFDQVDVGVAIALPDGLTVPVVRDVARRPLWEIARDLNDLVARAQADQLTPDHFGGTFTITNLGMYGVEGFTPIVNPPEVAILGVGAIQTKPVVVDGAVTIGERLTLSLTFDHRAVDGAPAAAFLARVRDILEKPYILLT